MFCQVPIRADARDWLDWLIGKIAVKLQSLALALSLVLKDNFLVLGFGPGLEMKSVWSILNLGLIFFHPNVTWRIIRITTEPSFSEYLLNNAYLLKVKVKVK